MHLQTSFIKLDLLIIIRKYPKIKIEIKILGNKTANFMTYFRTYKCCCKPKVGWIAVITDNKRSIKAV
jgi:hypothetical protein